MPAGATGDAVLEFVAAGVGVVGATTDGGRIGAGGRLDGETADGAEGLACWAEARAVERITRADGRKLEMVRRNMVIRK